MGWRAVFYKAAIDKSEWVSAEIRHEEKTRIEEYTPRIVEAPERWRNMAIMAILAYGTFLIIHP